ncbi:MAG: UDP-N-acetylglucosamine 2-epimerase (non-hydrolyzing) [Deltaproteobacteria bacterium]|nr:UDP-N-acetylglucosamine 2-epimerase (non-hydrolyzing) [Deltaproteobacteria bacterium]
MVVLGTRPEIIKLAPILFELEKATNRFQTDLVWSGQHIELAKPFLKLFGLKPRHSFEIMIPNQTSGDICSLTMGKLSGLVKKSKPDLLMVQGDTTTAFTAALCAFYHGVPVAHVEAGLRSGHPDQPFPEEKNRKLISHLSTFNFAPTLLAKQNLLKEKIDPKSVFVVGNSVIDAIQWLLKHHPKPKTTNFAPFDPKKEKLLLVTAHRRESFGTPLENICKALVILARRHSNLKIVFPVHSNPKVQEIVLPILKNHKQIHLMPPLDYVSFIHLLTQSFAILSDSGGVQEEAPALGKPALILRDVTERPEGIAMGVNRLVGRETGRIITGVEALLNDPVEYKKRARVCFPFGRGNAAEKIVRILKEKY